MASPTEETYEIPDAFKQVKFEVYRKLKTDDNEDYKRLMNDPHEVKICEQAMIETYDEIVEMNKHTDSLDNALRHLSSERQQQIKTTFRLQSFHVNIQKQPDGTVNLLFASLDGEPLSFVPSIVKIDSDNYAEYRTILAARIILEVVFLVLDFIGLKVTPSQKVIAKAMKYITRTLYASSKIIDDIKQMVVAAKRGDDSGIGRAVVGCVCDLFLIIGTPILQIVKMIISEMEWWQIIICEVRVLCWCATVVLTGGAAMVLKVVAWLAAATDFVMKLTQFNEFEGIQLSK